MKRFGPAIVVATLAIASLAYADVALGAFAPRFAIKHQNVRLTAAAPIELRISQVMSEETIGRAAIYVPAGYTASFRQGPGTVVGTATARARRGSRVIALSGRLTVGRAADFQGNSCTNVDGKVIWQLTLEGDGLTVSMPMFVTPVLDEREGEFGQFKIDACLESAAAQGLKLYRLNVKLGTIFRNPVGRGEYRWRARFVPLDNARVLQTARAVESQAIVRLPVRLQLNTRALGRHRVAVTGSLREALVPVANLHRANQRVVLLAGRKPDRLKRIRYLRTDTDGTFAVNLTLRGRWYFRAVVDVHERIAPQSMCTGGQTIAPGGCVMATLAPFTVWNLAPRSVFSR
jgi:hypothetical protein